jgi:hypothetical protein
MTTELPAERKCAIILPEYRESNSDLQRRQSPSGGQQGALMRRQPFRRWGSNNRVVSAMLR